MYVIGIVMHNRYSVGGHGGAVWTVINSLGYTGNMHIITEKISNNKMGLSWAKLKVSYGMGRKKKVIIFAKGGENN